MPPPEPHPCPLCGHVLVPPLVALRGGGQAHRACADRLALRAWRRRRMLALLHALSAVLVLIGLLGVWGRAPTIALALGWAVVHYLLHARFWHYIFRDLRRRLWRR